MAIALDLEATLFALVWPRGIPQASGYSLGRMVQFIIGTHFNNFHSLYTRVYLCMKVLYNVDLGELWKSRWIWKCHLSMPTMKAYSACSFWVLQTKLETMECKFAFYLPRTIKSICKSYSANKTEYFTEDNQRRTGHQASNRRVDLYINATLVNN